MEPAPALFEIRETKKYSFDVIDRRLAAPVWVASFRLFRDAKEYADDRADQRARDRLSARADALRTQGRCAEIQRQAESGNACDGNQPAAADVPIVIGRRGNPEAAKNQWNARQHGDDRACEPNGDQNRRDDVEHNMRDSCGIHL